MLEHVSGILTLIASIVGLAGLAGGLAALSKTKIQAATIAILETSNKARDDRIAYLESENARIETDLQAKSDALHTLTNIVTGREQLNEIIGAIKAHDAKLDRRDERLFGDLQNINTTLAALREKVSLRNVHPDS